MKFRIEGKIKAKARPRFANGHTYTPKETVNYENWVKLMYQQATREYFTKPVIMVVTAYFKLPKSYTKKKIAENPLPVKKPDCDNIGKIIADSLNCIAYNDDSQIVVMTVYKKWTNSEEYVEVEIMEA